jgi:hypothetical protein
MSKEEAVQVKSSVSLASLNVVNRCSHAEEMPFLDEMGEETGITFMVLGAHAPEVQKWTNKKLNARRRQDDQREKRGKNTEIRMVEDDIDFGNELISKRIVGWTGIDEEWSTQLSLQACTENPLIVEQVREFSEDLGNFGKSK